MTYEVEVWWLSPKTAKLEMVFARDLDALQANSLLGKIHNYGDWPELKSLIEKHEDKPISYLFKGSRTQGTKHTLELVVK
jgi:hypothetical protein